MSAAIEHLQPFGADFDLAGGQLRVGRPFRPCGHRADDQDHELRAGGAGQVQRFLAAFGGDDDLRLAVAVPQVEEHAAAVVAIAVDPAAKGDFLSDVRFAQFAASMCAKQSKVL